MGAIFTSIAAGGLLIVAVIAAIIALIVAKAWVKVAGPDEALIITGKGKAKDQKPLVVVQGRAIVRPLRETYSRISLRSRQVSLLITAQSSENVEVDIEATALVKIGSDPEMVKAAAERFASQDKQLVESIQNQMEGSLRGVASNHTVTGLIRDRAKIAEDISENMARDLKQQGLILDSFQIKGINDESGYIKSLGVVETASKQQAAEIATANADRAVTHQRTANAEADLVERTQYQKNAAVAAAEVGTAEAQAEQAKDLAREKALRDVLDQRALNKAAELEADVNKVADADRYRREQDVDAKRYQREQEAEAAAAEEKTRAKANEEIAKSEANAVTVRAQAEAEAMQFRAKAEAEAMQLSAKAEADSIRMVGEAKAAAVKAEGDALQENQGVLLAQQAVEILPEIVGRIADGYEKVGSMTFFSGGDSDLTAGARMAAENGVMLKTALDSVQYFAGVDLRGILQGTVEGSAQGKAMGEALSNASIDHVSADSVDSPDTSA